VSTLVQIELAVARLPAEQQKTLLHWLQDRLTATPVTPPAPSALEIFRQLQRETRLTPSAAHAWKSTVADARR